MDEWPTFKDEKPILKNVQSRLIRVPCLNIRLYKFLQVPKILDNPKKKFNEIFKNLLNVKFLNLKFLKIKF